MSLTLSSFRALALSVLSSSLVLVPAVAHDEPGSVDFDLLVPGFPLNGSITIVTLVGPDAGEEVLHTTWNLTYSAPPGGTPASDVMLELSVQTTGGPREWVVTGAEFGWPATTGVHVGSLDSDLLNGVLLGGFGGGLPISTPELIMGATTGGLDGQFLASTITLELAGNVVCQTDLGHAGPGTLAMQICGDPLATGGSATLSLNGAPAFATVLLAVGLQDLPTPFAGGTLVPVPVLQVFAVPADGAGWVQIHVPGGGGPVTVYLQAAVVDGSLFGGWALSNALAVELLP